MRVHPERRGRTDWLSVALMLASFVLIIGIFYWARSILIPIALAILTTFILTPIVAMLRRRGLGRTPSVIVTVILTFTLVFAIGSMIVVEFRALANELPAYRENIREKIADLRLASRGGAIERVQEVAKDIAEEISKDDPSAKPPARTKEGAIPVVITGNQPAERGMPLLEPLLEPLGTAGLVVVLAIFMLLRREDLRDRLLRLVGYGRLAATTKAIDEAGRQVSRYLLRQSLLNAGFGFCLGMALFFIGVPYAILWGFLAGVARFIPYVGPWIGAAAPVAMSLAVFDGWNTPLLILGMVVILELINNMVLEPMLYGQSIGVSEVALIVMMAFWTWLWGPIGLVLAAPMTVCVVVISKGVPELEFIRVLLGSEPALDPHHVFYQRLLAKDSREAEELVKDHLKHHPLAHLFEHVFIPTLIACRHDGNRERITEEDKEFVFKVIRQILEDLRTAAVAARNGKDAVGKTPDAAEPAVVITAPATENLKVLGCPASDEADELALLMLSDCYPNEPWDLHILSGDRLVAENVQEVENENPKLICIGCLPGGSTLPIRQFCKRLRLRTPDLRIVVGAWGATEREKAQHQLSGIVDTLGVTFTETRNQLFQLGQISAAAPRNPSAPAEPERSLLPANG